MRKSDKTKTKIIFNCTVLHEGWEMDNQAWVIELSSGEKQIMTTNHGRECGLGGFGVVVEWEDGTHDYVNPSRLDYYYED